MKEGWKYCRLGEVCSVLDSQRKPITKSNRQQGLIPYYGASGIQDYVADFIFEGRFLLVGEDGAKWGKNDKSAFIIEGKSWVNNHAHILKINKGVCDTFIEYYLTRSDLTPHITGAVVPKLTQAALVNIEIPLPPLEQQQQIVAELDLLSGIIEKQKRQLKELDTLAQSIFYDMFGDPVENEKGWNQKCLSLLCDITSSKRIFAEEYVANGIPFYRSKEVIEKSKGLPISIELFISNERYCEIKKKYGVPDIDDILITAVGTIGKIWTVDTKEPFYFKDGNLVWLREINKNEINSTFFKISLSHLIEEYKKTYAQGAAYEALTIMNLKKMQCILPPLPLQQEFACKIESIEHQKETISKSIGETQRLFDYTMDKYFG